MADEHPLTPVAPAAVDRPPRPRREPEFPNDPGAARAEIEATRARMSDTLDEIEDVLLRKKETIREKMDVMAPVREEPLRMIAMIFGAAVVLGFLSAGRGGRRRRDNHQAESLPEPERVEEDPQDDEAELAWERAEEWEDRAHRLLRIARAQEDELEIHRGRRDSLLKELRKLRERAEREEEEYDEEDEDELEPGFFERVRLSAADRLAGLAGEISHRMMRGG